MKPAAGNPGDVLMLMSAFAGEVPRQSPRPSKAAEGKERIQRGIV